MKRSIIATLLILVLALSGCKAQQEAGTAVPAERVEAEKKQETSQAVPEEFETEQELPAEEEKPVEQDLPTSKKNLLKKNRRVMVPKS